MNQRRNWNVSFHAPAAVLLAMVFAYPIARTAVLSFSHLNLATAFRPEAAGWDNYRRLLSDSRFLDSLRITGAFTIVTVAIEFGPCSCLASSRQTSASGERPGSLHCSGALDATDRRHCGAVGVDLQRSIRRLERGPSEDRRHLIAHRVARQAIQCPGGDRHRGRVENDAVCIPGTSGRPSGRSKGSLRGHGNRCGRSLGKALVT